MIGFTGKTYGSKLISKSQMYFLSTVDYFFNEIDF